MNLHIITGGSRGLGSALGGFFATKGDDVADISRSGQYSSQNTRSFTCDLSSNDSKENVLKDIFAAYPFENYGLISITNNAGMVDPIKHIGDLDEPSIAANIAVNLTAPIALTAAFLKLTSGFKGRRVITNVSTGVAKRPKGAWAAYSSAKAGLDCFSLALAKDIESQSQISVITFEPGIVDTEMQALIRKTDRSDFDEVDRFLNLKKEGRLLAPDVVGTALGELILRNDLGLITNVSVYDLIK